MTVTVQDIQALIDAVAEPWWDEREIYPTDDPKKPGSIRLTLCRTHLSGCTDPSHGVGCSIMLLPEDLTDESLAILPAYVGAIGEKARKDCAKCAEESK